MRKYRILSVIAFVAIAISAFGGNGLLWKVSGGGLQSPSYILGSHHVAPADFVDRIPGLTDAIAQVSAVYGEIDKGALSSAETQQKMMVYAIAPADSTLSRLLSPVDMAMLDSLLAAYTGMPGLAAQMEMLKPAAVSAQLSMLQIVKACPQMQTGQQFDAVVMSIGESLGKEIGGLETVDSQLQLLFGDPLTMQAADLMDAVRNDEQVLKQASDLTNAYLSQDLNALTAITIDPEYGIDVNNLDRLLYDRNRDWAHQLPALMASKPILVVVGAGHLGGEQGLLRLLQVQGFDITSVN